MSGGVKGKHANLVMQGPSVKTSPWCCVEENPSCPFICMQRKWRKKHQQRKLESWNLRVEIVTMCYKIKFHLIYTRLDSFQITINTIMYSKILQGPSAFTARCSLVYRIRLTWVKTVGYYKSTTTSLVLSIGAYLHGGILIGSRPNRCLGVGHVSNDDPCRQVAEATATSTGRGVSRWRCVCWDTFATKLGGCVHETRGILRPASRTGRLTHRPIQQIAQHSYVHKTARYMPTAEGRTQRCG